MLRIAKFALWLLLGLFGLVLLLQLWYFSHVLWYKSNNPQSTAFMRAQEKALSTSQPDIRLKHEWVAYEQISKHLKAAVIAAEDASFTDHDGVDWDAIEAAYDKNLAKGKVIRGGSTITMQLAKNLFLSGERSYWRKGQELVITYMLETVMDKQRILEMYLNVAEWGVGVFGAQAGAKHHYKISASQLGPAQAARMAAMLPRPRFYDVNRNSRYLARRAGIISKGMSAVEVP